MNCRNLASKIAGGIILLGLIATLPFANAQNMSTGALNVTVRDPAGAVINGAQLMLTDLGTGDVHRAVTAGAGAAVIPYLNPAGYSLSVSMQGFKTQVYNSVTIQTNQVTDLSVILEVGATTQMVTVSGNTAPLLNTTENSIATTVDLQEVEDLPVFARDAFSLAFLVPGAVGNNFNNLPGGAVDVSANGFSTMINRNKSAGFDGDGSSITNRLEDVQEMTIQTDQLDASHGGTSAMDIGFTTKRGTNTFHGQFFEDYRNDAMNANSWYNNFVNQRRAKLIINDFGGSIGGPLLKDKLFFFASLANLRQPSKFTVSTAIGTPQALAGIYSYIPDGSTAVQTANVLQAGASAGCSTCTGTVNTLIAQDLANIESTYNAPGVTFAPLDLNHETENFLNKTNEVQKFPTLRIDYNITQSLRLTGSVNESNSYYTDSSAPPFPGPLFANQAGGWLARNYQAVGGVDWNIRPTLVNAFRAGYLYTMYYYNPQGMNIPTAAMVEQGDLQFGFGLNSGVNGFNSLKGGALYPVLSLKDDSTWERGRHTMEFGVDDSTEIDHYYNNQFVPWIGVNYLSGGDPVANSIDNSLSANAPASAYGDVESLYATLNGRMTYYSLGQFVNARTKQFQPGISFNLHERLTQTALYFADSWRLKPELTLNYGLRWDFTGASKDETGFYTHPDIADMWGPTPVGALFQPGNLGGVQNPVEGPAAEAYAPSYVHPEPNVGVAWNPTGQGNSWFDRLTGRGKTVYRASYTLKNYTEGAQNFWNFGSNFGANFNTYFTAFPVAPSPDGSAPGTGLYNAGSILLGEPLPALASSSPIPYNPIITEASQGFQGVSYFTFDPHIKQPYIQSLSAGIERQLSPNNVLEVRYVGNASKDQWVGVNYNETNIFENGFLTNFKAAQANLQANGGSSFQGPNATPLFDQAFEATGGGGYTSSQFINYLKTGQAGALAVALAGDPSYLCSMVNAANFAPCVNAGASGSGTYPINVFQANPYAAGSAIDEMTNDGYSNYNALQVDFRQHMNHGVQFDVNYTFSHSLDNNIQGSTSPGAYAGGGNNGSGNSAPGYYTLRDKHLNYFPSSFDIRHVVHASGIYELPFGHDQPFFNQNRVANSIIGGWTLGTIIDWQGGDPHLFNGGFGTFNQNDGGLALSGVSVSQLQHQIGIRPGPAGKPWKTLFDPKYLSAAGQANSSYIGPNTTPGTIGTLMWLHDPKWINTDMSVNKLIPIHERLNFTLQGEFFNVFNHVAWAGMDTGVQDYTFGTTNGAANGPRNIELRGNFTF
jgi:hypothetical protein